VKGDYWPKNLSVRRRRRCLKILEAKKWRARPAPPTRARCPKGARATAPMHVHVDTHKCEDSMNVCTCR